MEVSKLYRISNGNRTEAIGFIIKGASVNVQVLGSQSKPAATSEMVDITENGAIISAGAYPFLMLPEYMYFDGTADSIEIVNGVAEDLGAL